MLPTCREITKDAQVSNRSPGICPQDRVSGGKVASSGSLLLQQVRPLHNPEHHPAKVLFNGAAQKHAGAALLMSDVRSRKTKSEVTSILNEGQVSAEIICPWCYLSLCEQLRSLPLSGSLEIPEGGLDGRLRDCEGRQTGNLVCRGFGDEIWLITETISL